MFKHVRLTGKVVSVIAYLGLTSSMSLRVLPPSNSKSLSPQDFVVYFHSGAH